jgi:hypothetical protein
VVADKAGESMNKPELIKTYEPDLIPAGCVSEAMARQQILDREKEEFFARGGKIEYVADRLPLVELPPINEFTDKPDHSRKKTVKRHNDKQRMAAEAQAAFYSGKQRPRPNRKSKLPVNIRQTKEYYTIDIRDNVYGQYPITTHGLLEAIKHRNSIRERLCMFPISESGWWDAHL